MIKVKVINRSAWPLPQYETLLAAGMDVKANLDAPLVLRPLQRAMVPTGLFVEIPEGYEIQVRPRSGLAAKHGISVLNTPGTIDADYRGEIKVILVNLSDSDFEVVPGERVAQIILAHHERTEWIETEELSTTDRGTGGFGSTGKFM